MVLESDIQLSDGRTLHVYDTGDAGCADTWTILWHHGTPNIGAPPAPLFPAGERLSVRWIAYDRPGYGGSAPCPGRNVATAAGYAAQVADALGIDRFAVLGHSGGGPHALACAALLPDRVTAVVSVAGLAPFGAAELDWFAGITPSNAGELRAATQGRSALEARLRAGEYDPEMFTPEDHAALSGDWSWFNAVVGPATEHGLDGYIDDDLAYVSDWGFDPARMAPPVLLLHGAQDRIAPVTHAQWLARHCPTAELRLAPGDGHLSILRSGAATLQWLREKSVE